MVEAMDMVAVEYEVDTEDGEVEEESDEVLIHLVESHPVIYDKSMKGHQKEGVIENEWRSIAETMNESVDHCRRSWERLKRKWVRARRILKKLSVNGPTDSHRVWTLYPALCFLDHHIQTRNTYSHTTSKASRARLRLIKPKIEYVRSTPIAPSPLDHQSLHYSAESSVNVTQDNERVMGNSSQDVAVSATRLPIIAPSTLLKRRLESEDNFNNHKKKKNEEDNTDLLRQSVIQLNSIVEKFVQIKPPEAAIMDGDEGFCRDILTTLRQITGLKNKLICKQRILTVLEDYIVD